MNTETLVERNDEINNTTDRRPFGNYTFREYATEIAKTNGFHLWKLLGDEVLSYHKVTSAEEYIDLDYDLSILGLADLRDNCFRGIRGEIYMHEKSVTNYLYANQVAIDV